MHMEPTFLVGEEQIQLLPLGEGRCLEVPISSMKVSGPINVTLPSHRSHSSVRIPQSTAPQNMKPQEKTDILLFWWIVLSTGMGREIPLTHWLRAFWLSRQQWKWRADGQPHLSAEAMTGHPQAPTKSLEMGLHGHVTDVFANPSELIHPNDCCSQGDHLKRNYSCSFPLKYLEFHP